jgi:hypothetical protein
MGERVDDQCVRDGIERLGAVRHRSPRTDVLDLDVRAARERRGRRRRRRLHEVVVEAVDARVVDRTGGLVAGVQRRDEARARVLHLPHGGVTRTGGAQPVGRERAVVRRRECDEIVDCVPDVEPELHGPARLESALAVADHVHLLARSLRDRAHSVHHVLGSDLDVA